MNQKDFLNEHKKYCDIELTDNECGKLKGMPFPGASVVIKWNETGAVDKGYLFIVPFGDIDSNDYFVHIPRPDNPGGKDSCEPEWKHINNILKNPYCLEIVVTSSNN